MSIYTYFGLGIVLGFSIAVVIWADRSEKFESKIKFERKLFYTKKLDNMIDAAANRILRKIEERKEDITEEDIKISIYEASITDGIIDDKNLFALEKMNTKDLKEAAQEIYDTNFKNKCNDFVSFLKMLFIH